MKTGELAKILGVDRKTIRNWIDDYGLQKFFSASALGTDGNIHRTLTEADVLVLNTIHHKRTNSVNDWNEIKDYLESGERQTEFPTNAIGHSRRTIPVEQAEQAARTLATIAERDAVLARVTQLEGEVERLLLENGELREKLDTANERFYAEKDVLKESLLREMGGLREKIGAEKDSLNASLMREIGNLQREIGKLEGELKVYQEDKERLEAKENPRDNL
jgi:DNA-binding transcriptional MerR regulator